MPLGIAAALTLALVSVGKVVTFPGTCDASAAVVLDGGRVAVANDEDNIVRIYSLAGDPAGEFPLSSLGTKEADIEGAARVGSRAYWITSHGRNKDGEVRKERRQFFATDATPGDPGLTMGPVTDRLLDAMLAAPGLGDLLREAAGKAPEAPGGLNIEGLAADGQGGLLIGFRNPVGPPTSGKAMVVPLANPDEALRGQDPRFQSPILLDLGGRGIRSIERESGGDSYLIVAGPTGDIGTFRLYRWDRAKTLTLLADLSKLPGTKALSPEALIETAPNHVVLFSDDGSMLVDGTPCKKAPVEKRFFRGVELTISPEPAGLAREAHWSGFNLYVDQDVFFTPAFDQDYTMGVEFVCLGKWVRQRHLSDPLAWLDYLSQARRMHATLVEDDVSAFDRNRADGFANSLHSVHFGNSAFTPRKADLGESEPLYDDRPYANLMYLKVRRTSARRATALVTDLTLGILGLNVGKWVQTTIHKSNGDVIPGGWGNQISNGGEPTLKYRVSPRALLASSAKGSELFRADLAASAEANLGYYTNASAGGRFRLGWIRSPWWSFERNAIADVRGGRQNRGVFAGGNPWIQEFFIFASAGGTVWAYNALLQGQFRHSNVTLGTDSDSPAPMRRLTSDAQVGATLRARPGVALTYAVQWLSPTFGGPKERTHSWGSVYISYQK